MRSKAAVATAVMGLVLALGVTTTAGAQGKKNSLTTRASAGRGDATSDQNIKQATASNNKASPVAAPVKKGGVRTRGSGDCALHVDNRTGLYVNLYTDGNFRGTISPWGDLEGWVGCGSTVFYARANYNDGTYEFWGPNTAYVSGPFLWTVSK